MGHRRRPGAAAATPGRGRRRRGRRPGARPQLPAHRRDHRRGRGDPARDGLRVQPGPRQRRVRQRLPEPERLHQRSASAAAEPVSIAGVSDFDPFGDPQEENSDLTALAVDGKPGTAWPTSTYDQNFGPGGLKSGVGLLLDLGSATDVRQVDVTLVGTPTTVELLASTDDAAPTSVDEFDRIASGEATKTKVTLTPDKPTSSRYLVVWLTSLPNVGGGFKGQVAEVVVRA